MNRKKLFDELALELPSELKVGTDVTHVTGKDRFVFVNECIL